MNSFPEKKGKPVDGWTPEFGERFEEIVSALGKYKDVSELVGRVPKQVSRWRNGHAAITLNDAGIICEAAEKSLDWLYSGKELSVPSIAAMIAALSVSIFSLRAVMHIGGRSTLYSFSKAACAHSLTVLISRSFSVSDKGNLIPLIQKPELDVVNP